MNLMSLTAVELGKKIKAKEVSVVEAVTAAISQIEALDDTYNCYRSVCQLRINNKLVMKNNVLYS